MLNQSILDISKFVISEISLNSFYPMIKQP